MLRIIIIIAYVFLIVYTESLMNNQISRGVRNLNPIVSKLILRLIIIVIHLLVRARLIIILNNIIKLKLQHILFLPRISRIV